MKIKNTSNASTSTILHRSKQRLIIITIGAILLVIGFFGAVSIGSIVVNEAANNKLTPQGYPETAFLGISAFSWEYALVFTTILGVFILSGGLLMDSKKKRLKNNNNS